MLALAKLAAAPGVALIDAADLTLPVAGEVLLDIAAVGICGTDLHIDEWTSNYRFMSASLPVTIGHEFSGTIAAIGDCVEGLAVGDLVTVMPSVTCGRCEWCVAGDVEHCRTRKGIGISRPGAFATQVLVPARNCFVIPHEIDAELAAMCEPLSVGAEAVRVAEMKAGDRVLIMGPGTIGQSIAMAARDAGATEIVFTGRDDGARLGVARQLGFDRVVDVGTGTLRDALERIGESRPFDRVFEATGVARVVNDGLSLLRPGGVIIISGIHAEAASIDLTAVVRNTLQIRGAYRASRQTWGDVIRRLQVSGEDYRPMITHRLPLSRALEGFATAHARAASKVMLFPQQARP